MDLDYQVYADGEALLGWLNCTARLSARESFDVERVLKLIASEVQDRLRRTRGSEPGSKRCDARAFAQFETTLS